MALFNKNGIRILKEEPEMALKKAAAAEKNYIEGDLAAPLAENLKAALRAAAAEKKENKKTKNLKKMEEAAKKRAAMRKKSAKAAQRLFAFVRGQAASLIEKNFEEIIEEVYSSNSSKFKIEAIFSILNENKEDIEAIINNYSLYDFIQDAKEKGVSGLLINVWIEAFRKLYWIDGSDFYLDDFFESIKNDPIALEEKLLAIIEDIMPIVARRRGRYFKALEAGISRPDLATYYNIDPEAFNIVDKMAREIGLEPANAYDSYGVWGISPHDIAKAWYAAGAKNHPKFRVWVKRTLQILKEEGRLDGDFVPLPYKNESVNEYKNRLKFEGFMKKYWRDLPHLDISNLNYDVRIKVGDKKRLSHLNSATIFYALSQCLVNADIIEGDYCDVHIKAIDWQKVAEFFKMNKKQKAAYLPFKMAWSVLFNRKAPAGLGAKDPHPVVLADRVTQRTFRQLMQIIKSESSDESALEANTKAAYHLAVAFRDMQTVKRWVKAVTGADTLSSIAIHDAFVNANAFTKVSNRAAWAALLIQFPELRWQIGHAPSFEREYGRMPSGKKEFETFAAGLNYEDVTDLTVASIAAGLGLDQDDFEDYQKFFEENPGKKATMLPDIQVSEGEYTFRKLDDHDKRGPFLGLMTACCQHLHNAGASCAEAGWRDPESGFYIVEKNGDIVAQSWAWRGKDGELCFDSIEGLGNVNIEKIAILYQKAAQALLGKLGITRVTVGDTSYGLTPDIKGHLRGKECEAAEMIKSVSYTDARSQWLLAAPEGGKEERFLIEEDGVVFELFPEQ